MPNQTPAYAVAEAFTIYRPKTIDPDRIAISGTRPVISHAGVIGFSEEYNHPDPQIVLISRGEGCGRIFITDEYAWLTGDLLVIRAKIRGVFQGYAAQYFRWLMQRPGLVRASDGSAVDRVQLLKQAFILPEWEIQKEISHHLDDVNAMELPEQVVEQMRSEAFRFSKR